MAPELTEVSEEVRPLKRNIIEARLADCPRLPSLRTIETALRELLQADQRYTQQVADVIRRDPSLTARLLRLVNSVYYGLSVPVSNLEEAVFYLGLRQIRQLVTVTPILEDFQRLTRLANFSWREFWQHCIGTAILTREVMVCFGSAQGETEYVAGLVHDVGKIAMAHVFPDHFHAIYQERSTGTGDLLSLEESVLGMNHAELGALYLGYCNLPSSLIETARFHHEPERAGDHAPLAAAVQIADLLMQHARIGKNGRVDEITERDWTSASGWLILCPMRASERSMAQAELKRSLDRLPLLLNGLI